jgi:hypothetical protein
MLFLLSCACNFVFKTTPILRDSLVRMSNIHPCLVFSSSCSCQLNYLVQNRMTPCCWSSIKSPIIIKGMETAPVTTGKILLYFFITLKISAIFIRSIWSSVTFFFSNLNTFASAVVAAIVYRAPTFILSKSLFSLSVFGFPVCLTKIESVKVR